MTKGSSKDNVRSEIQSKFKTFGYLYVGFFVRCISRNQLQFTRYTRCFIRNTLWLQPPVKEKSGNRHGLLIHVLDMSPDY